MSNTKRKPLNDVPVEELTKLRDEGHSDVNLRVTRRNSKGQWASIGLSGHPTTVDELLSGEFETYLEGYAGGGDYLVEVRAADDPTTHVAPRFMINVAGRPKDPRTNTQPQQPSQYSQQVVGLQGGSGGAPPQPPGVQIPPGAYQAQGVQTPQMIGPGQLSLPPQEHVPNWARAYPAADQWGLYYDAMRKSGKLPEGASMHSDSLAKEHANTWQNQWSTERAENAKLRETLNHMQDQLRELQDRSQKQVSEVQQQYERQLAEMKEKAQQEKYEAQLASLRDEIRAAKESKPVGPNWAEMLPALAPVAAPLIQGFFQSGESRQKAMMDVMTAAQKSNMDWSKILPALTPIVVKYLESSGPEAKANMQAQQDQTRIAMMTMLMDNVREQLAQAEPTLLDKLQPVLEAIGGSGLLSSGGPQVRALPPAGEGEGGGGGERPQQRSNSIAVDDATWQQLAQYDAQAAKETQLVLKYVPPNSGFHTHEWRILLFNIHARLQPEELVPTLIDHLEHCTKFVLLPGALQNWATAPRETIESILLELPVAKRDPDYVNLLIDTFARTVEERMGLEPTQPSEDEDTEESGEDDYIEANGNGAQVEVHRE